MITLNENILDENLHQLIDNIDVETIKQAAKEQPNFRSFYLSYGQEGHLIDLLKFIVYFNNTHQLLNNKNRLYDLQLK